MIISQELRKTNIAEYVLYMWQTEDQIRAFGIDIEQIKSKIVENYQVDDELKKQIEEWYSNIIQMMELEGIEKQGHLQVIKNIVSDIDDLHLRLLAMSSEYKYQKAYADALPHITLLKGKINNAEMSDVDVCLHGLYGILLLRIKKIKITEDTNNSVNVIKEMISLLAARYNEREKSPERFYE